MRVSHKQKELFEKDVRSYHRLNDENNYLFLRMQKGKKYIFGWLVLVGLYFVLPHEFDYLIEVVFTISFFWVFDFLRLSELRKKNDKQIKRLVKNFENKSVRFYAFDFKLIIPFFPQQRFCLSKS